MSRCSRLMACCLNCVIWCDVEKGVVFGGEDLVAGLPRYDVRDWQNMDIAWGGEGVCVLSLKSNDLSPNAFVSSKWDFCCLVFGALESSSGWVCCFEADIYGRPNKAVSRKLLFQSWLGYQYGCLVTQLDRCRQHEVTLISIHILIFHIAVTELQLPAL